MISRRPIAFFPILVLLALVGTMLPVVGAQPGAAQIEPLLRDRLAAEGRADFLITFAAQADLAPAYELDWAGRGEFVYHTLRETAARSQAGAIAYLEARGLAHETFIAGNELYVWAGDLAAVEALAGRPEVDYIRAPRTYFLDPIMAEAAAAPEALAWGIVDTKADQFWAAFGVQGDGVKVAGIDTGVQWDHPALDQAFACPGDPGNAACWRDPSNICPGGTACDNNGHGTHTMGTMVADDDPTLTWQAGMAPNAQWIACKGCESSSCSEFALNSCADWILAPAGNPANRPHVVNNSWGGGSACDGWYHAKVAAWRAAGVFPAFSAGNAGSSCNSLGQPGNYQDSFATASHASNRTIASTSSRGPAPTASPYCHPYTPYTKPNISAPGVSVCSPVPGNGWSCGYSGTSMASPHTAGAVALLWSCNPALIGNMALTFDLLQDNADPPPDGGNCGAPPTGLGNYTWGYGPLNVYAAGQLGCGAEELWRPGPAMCFDLTRLDAAYYPATGQVYVMGGRSGADTVGTIYAFDPATGACQPTGATMPVPISNYSISRPHNGTRDVLCTFGGRDSAGAQTLAVQCYDPIANTAAVVANLPAAYTGYTPGAQAVVNNLVYILGGFNPNAAPHELARTDRFNPLTNTFTQVGDLSLARAYLMAAAVDGAIYAFGGTVFDGASLVAQARTEKMADPGGAGTWDNAAVAEMPQAGAEGRAFGFDDTGAMQLRPRYATAVPRAPAPAAPGVDDPAAVAELAGSAVPDTVRPAGPATIWNYPTAVLWDNGPLVTHPGGGYNGADASALQSALAMNTYGFGNQQPLGYRMADDLPITHPGGWQIATVTFFAYQTATYPDPPPSTITGLYLQIWDGPPDAPGSSIVWGDLTTNRLQSTGWTNIYRSIDTDLLGNTRPIMANVATVGVTLPPGTYWLDWTTAGSGASGPWAPPVTILGQTTTGNALQYTTAWAPALDTGTSTQQGMPFIITGSPVGGGGGQVVLVPAYAQWPGNSSTVVAYDVATDTYDETFPNLITARRNHAGALVTACSADPDDGLPGMWVWGGRADSDNPPYAPAEYYPLVCGEPVLPPACQPFSSRTQSGRPQQGGVSRGHWASTDFQAINLALDEQPIWARILDHSGQEVYAYSAVLRGGATIVHDPGDNLPPDFVGTLVLDTPGSAAMGILHLEPPPGTGGSAVFPGVSDLAVGPDAYVPVDACTRVHIHNLAQDYEAQVQVYIFDPQGYSASTLALNIPPAATVMLNPIQEGELPIEFVGTAVLAADRPIMVTVQSVCAGYTAFVASPYCGRELYAPYVLHKMDQITTTITVQNPNNEPAWGDIEFTGYLTLPFSLEAWGSQVFQLGPWSSLELPAQPDYEGAAVIRSNIPVAVFVQIASGDPAAPGTAAYRALDYAEAERAAGLPILLTYFQDWKTADHIWVMNVGTEATRVTIRYSNTADDSLDWDTQEVLPGEVWRATLPDLPGERAAAILLADPPQPIVALAGATYQGPEMQDALFLYGGSSLPFDHLPVAGADFSFVVNGNVVTLDGAVAQGAPPIAYRWALGDGSTREGAHIVHIYDGPGSYTVVLTATNALDFYMATATHTVTVEDGGSIYRIYLPLVVRGQ